MDPHDPMFGVYLGIGIFAIIIVCLIIFIPRQIRKAKQRASEATRDISAEIKAATGLVWDGQAFSGNYQGYTIRLEKGLVSNKAAWEEAERDFWWDPENPRDLHGTDTVYPVVRVHLIKDGISFPDVTFFQTSNWFLNSDEHRNNRLNGRVPEEEKLDIDAKALHKKGTFYGNADGANKMLRSIELQKLMSSWIYPDVRAEGTQVKLELNNSNIIPKWGYKKTSGTEWMVQAVDICVATAKALEN